MRAYPRFLNLIVALCGTALLITTQCAALGNDGMTLSRIRVHGASVCVIAVDLNDPSLMVDVGLPQAGISHHETFGTFLRRHAPLAAVTGTYFDMRTLLPTGSIVVGGKIVHLSHIGTAVCFMSGNKVKFVDAKFGEACDLAGAQCGMRTGPRLLAGGQYALDPRREGFRHPGLFGARTRMALGVTAGKQLLLVFVGTPVNFARLASIMKALDAVDAVCLDGGTSSAMYFKGRIVHQPGRMLTNLIEIYRRPLPVPPAKQAAANGYALASATVQWRPMLGANRKPDRRESETDYEQDAIMCDSSWLRFAKGVHTLFPVNRA
jgi:hypothetical protein